MYSRDDLKYLEDMHRLLAYTMPFYIRERASMNFGIVESWKLYSTDRKDGMYFIPTIPLHCHLLC